jgi:ABC-type oligopeptide transport system ATPase subunit
MIQIVFLIGRPGSGKSTVAQLIQMFAIDRGWIALYVNDYKLLQQMFFQEKAGPTFPKESKFSPSGPKECNGFDVRDFSVLDTVLEMMADQVRKEKQTSTEEKKLVLIEFARK